jgi:hypothetical protein
MARWSLLLLLAAWVPVSAAGGRVKGTPWEISTAGGYLRGSTVVQGASRADQFDKQPLGGVRRFLAYDKEGKSNLVGQGAARLWEFERRGPEEVYIRAAEGKWKGYYLRTSARAFRDGASFGYLLELGKEPQTFYVYQVSK